MSMNKWEVCNEHYKSLIIQYVAYCMFPRAKHAAFHKVILLYIREERKKLPKQQTEIS